jgi:NAD(P)-dependent dehydrogenase (short-subunit alcohol dehydrogenase family)
MAREGADISIVYLPEEQEDAEATKAAVERENQSCLLLPGDLMDRNNCQRAVEEHIKKSATMSLCLRQISVAC